MKSLSFTMVLLFFIMLCVCGSAPHPTTYVEMVKAYRSAHKFKNISRIERLVYWGNMPDNSKKRILEGIEKTFSKTIEKMEIGSIPSDLEMKRGNQIFPFSPEKSLKVSYENPGKRGGVLIGTEYALGKREGKVYILYRSEDVPK